MIRFLSLRRTHVHEQNVTRQPGVGGAVSNSPVSGFRPAASAAVGRENRGLAFGSPPPGGVCMQYPLHQCDAVLAFAMMLSMAAIHIARSCPNLGAERGLEAPQTTRRVRLLVGLDYS